MANRTIRPDPTNTTGLTAVNSKLGTNVANCRVYAHNAFYTPNADLDHPEEGKVTFTASYFWNLAAWNDWKVDQEAVRPFLVEQHAFYGINEDVPLREQCLDYLLTLPKFSTGWIKA